jgi:hypothetical protein
MTRRLRRTIKEGSWAAAALGIIVGLTVVGLVTGTLVTLAPSDPGPQPQPRIHLMRTIQ